MIAEGWLVVYMDDLLISSPNKQIHKERTKRVLQCLKDLVLWPGEITMDPTKLDGIRNWPTPTSVKQVQSFLGFANYYQKFITHYSDIACPLIDLTRKDKTWFWSNSCQNVFNQLKNMFLSEPVLRFPDTSKPFTIATDASKFASGGVLLQTDTNGDWHPCSYIPQSFTPAEQNYDIYDQELLAIIRGLKTWRHYLHSSPFPVQVFTDHKNLTYFKEARKLNRRQAHWLLDLVDFNLQLIHLPGKELTVPDALSCRPDLSPDSDSDNEDVTLLPPSLFINLIDTVLSDKISTSSEKDPLVLKSLQALGDEVPSQF